MKTKRIHLFEFEDQKWFPQLLRNYETDFLEYLANKAKENEPVVDVINETLHKSNTTQIIDLGSGGGGGLVWLGKELQKKNSEIRIKFTDLFPNVEAFQHTTNQSDIFEYHSEPINAKNVPENLKGLRTMFLSFHHFQPKNAKMILQNAINSNQPIAVLEIQDRSLPSIVAMLLSPVSVLFTTPFIRPFRWSRLFFTYLIPIVPFVVLWDGIVSALRTYTVEEMRNLINSLENNTAFEWNFNKKKSKTGFVIYTIGIPKKQ